MNLSDVLRPSAVLTGIAGHDKAQLLHDLAEAASREAGLKARDIERALLDREQIGSTGLGRGIAIPHGRMPGLARVICLFARLERPIAFGSVDGDPVDLVFVLLAPEHAGADHLRTLARISRLVRDPATVQMLRAHRDPATLYAILTKPDAPLSKAG